MEYIFLNRAQELAFLRKLKKKNFFLVVQGRRRVGKTTLLTKAFPEAAYIFVWPDKSLGWITKETCKELGIPLFSNFSDIVEYLFEQGKIVIIDEFQNFLNVDKSVYGEMQRIIDKRKLNGKNYRIIACGSSHSLSNKVFNSAASPLYGRRTSELRVEHLPVKELFNWLNVSMQEFIEIWSVFEGIPYYYELINPKKTAKENISALLLSKNAILQNEGKAVLEIEFGNEAKTYHTILMAVSEGNTKLSEISAFFEGKATVTIKYLNSMSKNFSIITRNTPITSNPKKSKEGLYEINDNFLKFWFRFVEKNKALFEQNRHNEIQAYFEKNFNQFAGTAFEKFVLMLIKTNQLRLPKFTAIGRQWGKIPGKPKGENTYEIDIVALNEFKKEALFCECKWKEKVNAEKVLKELKEKSQYVQWHNQKRKERFAVFAKSFSKKTQGAHCFDLKDLEKAFRK